MNKPDQSIATATATLEPLMATHAAALFPILTEPALYEFLDTGPPDSLEALRDRFERLEARASPDGSEQWLNWAVRMPSGAMAGYLQATIHRPGSAWIAYMLSTRYWGLGIARNMAAAMIEHLHAEHGCREFLAVVERGNARSVNLLRALSFHLASAAQRADHDVTASEDLYVLHRAPAA